MHKFYYLDFYHNSGPVYIRIFHWKMSPMIPTKWQSSCLNCWPQYEWKMKIFRCEVCVVTGIAKLFQTKVFKELLRHISYVWADIVIYEKLVLSFLHLKLFLCDQQFNDNDETEGAVTTWLASQATSFYEESLQILLFCQDKYLIHGGNY